MAASKGEGALRRYVFPFHLVALQIVDCCKLARSAEQQNGVVGSTLCQYLYFCTSNVSKMSTSRRHFHRIPLEAAQEERLLCSKLGTKLVVVVW